MCTDTLACRAEQSQPTAEMILVERKTSYNPNPCCFLQASRAAAHPRIVK